MIFAELDFKQFCDLRSEFVDFKIQDMTTESMISFIREVMYKETEKLGQQDLKDQVDKYDENLYDILVSYVKDEESSSEVLEEFKHERWVDD